MKRKRKQVYKRMLPFYIMVLPGLFYLIMNNYIPMFGVILAFKKLEFNKGIFGSDWCGFNNFKFLFSSGEAFHITRNTIGYNLIFMAVGTVLAIALAIMLHEVRKKTARTIYQCLILLPYLMSWVIVSYLAYAFFSGESGMLNGLLERLGAKPVNWYNEKKYWPYIIVFFNTWKTVGYSLIIYLAGIVGISQDYYEAARLDGAGKWQQIVKITLPLIKPTIITLLILNLGNIFRSDFGLFYQLPRKSGALFSVTQTLDVYIYQALMKNNNFGMASAASFYQAIVGFILIVVANMVVRKISKENALF